MTETKLNLPELLLTFLLNITLAILKLNIILIIAAVALSIMSLIFEATNTYRNYFEINIADYINTSLKEWN